MEYIDKSTNRQPANKIIDKLLSDAWSNSEVKYLGADYNNGLREREYREPFVDIIISEQSDLCCYCMKIITQNNITLEHIIPDNIHRSDANLSLYFKVPELANHVIHKKDFIKTVKQIPPKKYPHDIAYVNLIGSCDSNTSCNHYRGEKFINPLFYDNQITQKIQYNKKGRIDTDEYEDDCEKLGISTNQNLIQIRRVWKLLSERIQDLESLADKEKYDKIDEEIYELIDEPDYVQIVENFTGNPSYKGELLAYKWFYHYYKQPADESE